MQVRKVIAAALAAGAMALAAPGAIALADPATGPGGINDPAVTDYSKNLNDLIRQWAAGQIDQQQLLAQVTNMNDNMRQAITASLPNGAIK